MTDISESGIEAALLPCPFCGVLPERKNSAHGFYQLTHGTPPDGDHAGWRCPAFDWRATSPMQGHGSEHFEEAIAAWNRRAPYGREAGLREAADAARKNFHTMQLAANSLRIERDQAREALRTIIAADDDFRASMAPGTEKDPVTLACDRARVLIPTKPEAGESEFDATDLDMIRSGDRLGPKLGAKVFAALQSKKPE